MGLDWEQMLKSLACNFYTSVAASKLAIRADPVAAPLPALSLANSAATLAAIASFLSAHARQIDAIAVDADYIARALAMAGLPGAAVADQALRLEPAALAEVQSLLPLLGKALPILIAMQPAPTYQAGPGSGIGANAQRGR